MMTLAQARLALVDQATADGDPFSPQLLKNLNGVLERFYVMGKWKSCHVEIALTVYDGTVTLPRQCQSMMFLRKNSNPVLIKNQWFEWLQFGLGFRDADKSNCHAYDQGSRFCSFRDFTTPRQLRAKALGTEDAGISVTFQGRSEDGRRIYSPDTQAKHPVNGATVALSAGIGTTSQLFASFEGFYKPVTTDYVEIWTVNPDDGTDEMMIALYEPGETTPQYRRYKIGKLSDNTVLSAICKLQFVPLASEMDMVIPSNVNALESGLMARHFGLQSEQKTSAGYWTEAFSILNSELAQDAGGANAPIVFDFDGVGPGQKIGRMM